MTPFCANILEGSMGIEPVSAKIHLASQQYQLITSL